MSIVMTIQPGISLGESGNGMILYEGNGVGKESRSVPVQDHLSAVPFFHHVKALLEFVNVEAVGDYRVKVDAADYHHLHLVPGFPHLAAVYALQRQSLEYDVTPWNLKV